MGPLWDFDASLGATDSWAAIHNRSYSFYYNRLLQREDFSSCYTSQWEDIRETLYDDVVSYLREISEYKGEAIDKSRIMNTLLYPDDEVTPFEEKVDGVSKWLEDRIAWLNSQLLPDNINASTTISPSPIVYDIYGRPQNGNLDRGIYIIDGKKVYVR